MDEYRDNFSSMNNCLDENEEYEGENEDNEEIIAAYSDEIQECTYS
jgi:hypothetical protein